MMMKKQIYTLLITLFIAAMPMAQLQAQPSKSMGIAATVNEDAISEADVVNRMKLIFASSGIPNTPDNVNKVRPQAINILIEEQLKIQAAKQNNLIVAKEEIDDAFKTMAANNKLTAREFAGVMQQSGIPHSTLLRQIEAEISWRKVISRVLRPQVDVTENDVSAKLDRLKRDIGQTEYAVSEIFMPVDASKDEAKIKDLAGKLIQEIKLGRAPFALVARQFSKSASAAQGGAMGWVQAGELPKELDVVVKSLSKGQISPPIRGLSGFHILTLTEKRNISEETLPQPDDVLNAIGLQRLEKLQKRHLADIRASSFIDRRDQG